MIEYWNVFCNMPLLKSDKTRQRNDYIYFNSLKQYFWRNICIFSLLLHLICNYNSTYCLKMFQIRKKVHLKGDLLSLEGNWVRSVTQPSGILRSILYQFEIYRAKRHSMSLNSSRVVSIFIDQSGIISRVVSIFIDHSKGPTKREMISNKPRLVMHDYRNDCSVKTSCKIHRRVISW